MNHADRVIAEAKQAAQKHRAFVEANPGVAERAEAFSCAVREVAPSGDWMRLPSISPEENVTLAKYYDLMRDLIHAERTLMLYEIEVR